MSRMDSRMWFAEVIPALANLLLRLPSLLEAYYLDCGSNIGLRIMRQQEAGIVFLSQVSIIML